MDVVVHIISGCFLLAGSILMLVGGLGLIRMPDLYTRLHAASVTDTGAAILIIAGLFIEAVGVFANPMAAIKLLLILFFMLFTSPTASHALAKTALLSGLVPENKQGEPILASPEDAKQLADSNRPDP